MLIVFTDLDATLLDHHTYSYEESKEGINLLKEKNYPLVLVSSKTRLEMQELHRELELAGPFIFENGGGICFPGEKNKDSNNVKYVGKPIEEIKTAVPVVESAIGSGISLISDMSINDIIEKTGLSPEQAEAAQERETTLPFILKDTAHAIFSLSQLNEFIKKTGCTVTKGGRFYHIITRGATKGAAVKELKNIYSSTYPSKKIVTAALGDSENDLSMLLEVDQPFLVKKYDGTALDVSIPKLRITEGIGPAGFTEAVKILLDIV